MFEDLNTKKRKWRVSMFGPDFFSCGEYSGKRKSGEIWEDRDGVHCIVYTARGEGALMDGTDVLKNHLKTIKAL